MLFPKQGNIQFFKVCKILYPEKNNRVEVWAWRERPAISTSWEYDKKNPSPRAMEQIWGQPGQVNQTLARKVFLRFQWWGACLACRRPYYINLQYYHHHPHTNTHTKSGKKVNRTIHYLCNTQKCDPEEERAEGMKNYINWTKVRLESLFGGSLAHVTRSLVPQTREMETLDS